MKLKYLRGTLFTSLLVAAVACNSRPPAFAGESVNINATSLPTSAPTSAPSSPAAIAMKESLEYLASDELEGRGLGTGGIDQAASFIAGNFHGAGLKPLPGLADYFQRFEMVTADGIAPETFLTINGKSLKLHDEFNPLSFSGEKSFDAPAVFVGYGITDKAHHYDDYAGVDIQGKIAVAWRFEPADGEGKSKFTKDDWSDAAHLDSKTKNAADHGAVALILMTPPLYKAPDFLLPFAREFMGSSSSIPVVHLTRAAGAAFISEAEGKGLQESIDEKVSPQSKPLDAKVSGRVAVKRTTRHLKNVVAYLPGSGPHADEYVVVGGHYDHLGRGGFGSLSPKSKEIHHGADDNGSGTAAVIELAQEYAARVRQGEKLPRSIIFMSFTAEEEGLIGSAHFVSHPPVPLNKIVAMLNLDMVGRLREETLFVGGAGTAPSLERILRDADAGLSIKLKDMGKGGRGPSDHMSFAMKKIPVLFFFTGVHVDYHRPTDTVAKINFNGMAEVVQLSSRVIDAMTTMPKEEYVSAADEHSMSMGMGSGGGGHRATLGVVPSYGEDPDVKGVRITGTSPGSPAEAAGLKEGDTLVGFNDKNIENLMDLSNFLAAAKPGDQVKIRVLRDKKELSVPVKLAERK